MKPAFGVTLAMLLGAPAHAQTTRSCVDVKIGEQQYYDCINHQLALAATGPRASARDAPLGVESAPVALGEFNQAAVRERLGSNYGKSVVPQRPPPPNFTSPLVHH